MSKVYWLHRISNEWEVSYSLLKKGYLSLGWSAYSGMDVLEAARKKDKNNASFREVTKEQKSNKARWDMFYFAQFKPEDIVLVPMLKGQFQLFEVKGEAVPINNIKDEVDELIDTNNKRIVWGENGLLYRGEQEIGIGFAIRVKPISDAVLRKDYAGSSLTSRMKMRQTNGNISDLASIIEDTVVAINNKSPINFYKEALETASKSILKKIKEDLTDVKFELLVKEYMRKIGADEPYIPAKNETDKEDHADADVIANFDKLKVTIIIQVKKHKGETDKNAVEQIIKYKSQLEAEDSDLSLDGAEGYTVVPWVITSGTSFNKEAKEKAKNHKVQLFTGEEFARMLIDAGISGIII